MIIRRLKASFGRLSGDELELKDGLNVITAPNEAGKSTWTGFIRAMFYGIDTGDRDKQGYIADKNRYRPWSGAPMEGVMEVQAWDRPVRLTRRTLSQNAPMRSFSAEYTDTGDEVANISGESAGMRLLGVEAPVFERSCYVRQHGVGVDRAPELERRIQSLVSSGDEEIAYSEANAALKAWKNRIRHNNTGELPRTEERIAELKSRLERQREINREAGELRARIMRLEAGRVELLRAIELHEQRDRAADIRRRYDAQKARDAAAGKKQQADEALTCFEKMPMRGSMQQALDALAALEPARERVRLLSQSAAETKKAAEQAKNARDGSKFFSGMTADEAWSAANETADKAKSLKEKAKPKAALLAVLWVVLLAAAAAGFILLEKPVGWIAALVCVLAALVVTAVLTVKSKKAAAELAALLKEYDGETGENLLKAASDYREKCAECARTAEKVPQAEETLAAEQALLDKLSLSAMEPVTAIKGSVSDEREARAVAERAIALIEAQSEAGAELRAAEQLCAAVGEYRGETPVDITSIGVPAIEKEKAVGELAETRAQLESCSKTLAAQEGAVGEIGDIAAMTAELEQLKERREALNKRCDALEGAIEVLGEADAELRARFSPALNKRTGEILEKLTRGRYATVMMNSKFEAEAMSQQDIAARRAGMLSAGTIDQIYLALRLAVSEMVLPEGANPPLILDDALADFDDGRMQAALDWLLETAEKRQIILFTCHSRESEYLKGRESANLIEL